VASDVPAGAGFLPGTAAEDEAFLDEVVSAAKAVLAGIQTKQQASGLTGQVWPPEAWNTLRETGWLAAGIAADDGGLGLGLQGLTRLAYLAGRFLVTAPVVDQSLAVAVLQRFAQSTAGGTGAVLPAELVSGDLSLAVAWDATVPAVRTAWQAVPSGPSYLVRNGSAEMVLIPSAGGPGHLARIYRRDDPGVFLEPLGGFDPGAGLAMLHLDVGRAVPRYEAAWSGAVSPLVLRGIGQLVLASELCGIAAAAIDLAVQHATVRTQFDQQIGAFQAVKHMLVGSWTKTQYLQNMCISAARLADSDITAAELHGAAAKLYGSRAARLATETALQVHGGIGFTTECAVQLYLKRALSLQGLLGEEDDLAEMVGQRTLAGAR
jgi:alkylation response protein AidB-like acyl-CoA dehydrogenase